MLADSISAHSPFPDYDTIPFRSVRGGAAAAETVTSWTLEQEVQPGNLRAQRLQFRDAQGPRWFPNRSLPRRTRSPTFQIYDYPGEYGTQGDGTDYSRVRIEELHSQHEIVHGTGNARGVAAGYTFTLANSPRKDQNRSYLITSASYHLNGYKFGSGASNGEDLFSCSFTAIDSTKPFRAARVTPKPLIQGPQTAIVVGPAGEEIHTDKYGRIVVQFHWDRYGKADENSSCWVRVSPGGLGGANNTARCTSRAWVTK